MATIADLVVKVTANTAGAERDISTFSGKVGKGLGKGLLPAVAVLGGLGIAAKKSADAASNLAESQNAVNVVFGPAADKIERFAQVADKKAGLSMRQLNELVTPLGAGMRNVGDSADVAADKSLKLAQRAADMASVFNTSVPDALEAIQAGLRGEADPLEKFGVGLNETAVNAKAMSMGLAKSAAEVTAADKAQARYALIMEQTNRLQGDFANTADGMANKARINAAAQENLTATMGKGLLPTVGMLQGVLSTLLGVMAKHPQIVMILAAAIGILAAAIVALNIVMAIAASIPLAIIVGLVALGAALAILWVKCETFRNIVTAAWEHIKAVSQAAWPAIRAIITTTFSILKGVFTTYFNVYKAIVMTGIGAIKLAVHGISAIIGIVTTVLGTVKSTVTTAWNGIKSVVTGAVDDIKTAVRAGFNALDGIIQRAAGPVRAAAGAIKSALQPIISVLETIISTAGRVADALGKIGSLMGKVKGGIGGITSHIPHLASGGRNIAGGVTLVGERGPELLNLPKGADVFSNYESRKMMAGGDSGGVTVQIENFHAASDSDLEVLAQRINRLLAFGT